MYPTCRTDGVWRSLVARPLWERKVVGSNPATPTSIISSAVFSGASGVVMTKIALWAAYRLRLLCKLRARVSDVPGPIR